MLLSTRLARWSAALGILASLSVTPALAAPETYSFPCCIIPRPGGPTIVDLDTGTPFTSHPAAINNSAKVVGSLSAPGIGAHAFSWQSGVLSDIGTLPNDTGGYSMALGVGQAGDVVGVSEAYNSLGVWNAFQLHNGAMSEVQHRGGAFGINSSGQIGGYIYDASGLEHAGVFQNGTFSQAPNVTGCPNSEGHGINDSGTLIFVAICSNLHFHAATSRNGVLYDLGGPFNGDSIPNGINVYGQVAGDWTENGFHRGALWTGGVVYSLNPLPGHYSASAAALNSHATSVGYSQDSAGVKHAVQWLNNGTVQDLSAQLPAGSGWVLEYATGINDNGQVVGVGLHNGVEHGFLFTPAQQPVACCG